MAAERAPKASVWERVVEWGRSVLDDEVEVPRHLRPERADATIARVRQIDETSCGVAVAAMLARQNHATVKAFMFPKPKRVFYTHYKDVWRALDHFGVHHEKKVRKFEGWKKVSADALVKIRWEGVPARHAYHWVLFQRLPKGAHRLIDPAAVGDTLAELDPSSFTCVNYCVVTPRTSAEGPLEPCAKSVPPPPKPPGAIGTPNVDAVGNLTVMNLRTDDGLVLAVATATNMTRGAVRNRALKADGRTRIHKVFADRWPSRLEKLGAQLTPTAILRMSVQQARAVGDPKALAGALGIRPARFSRRLKSAHGSSLLKNALADRKSSPDPVVKSAAPC